MTVSESSSPLIPTLGVAGVLTANISMSPSPAGRSERGMNTIGMCGRRPALANLGL